MSGGSMGYLYSQIEEHISEFEDPEIEAMAADFAKLAKKCEWYHSADTDRESYLGTLLWFKKKWIRPIGDPKSDLMKHCQDMADAMFGYMDEKLRKKLAEDVDEQVRKMIEGENQ